MLRRLAGRVRRRVFPSADLRAWRAATRSARSAPRFEPGRIRMAEYDIEYSDLLTFCPQWYDVFVARSLDFRTAAARPRIVDCGANIGLASLYFKRIYPAARITAFEADPVIFGMLRRNLDVNGASDVEAVQAAIWVEDGNLQFQSEGADSGMVAALPGAVDGRTVSVPSVRLRDLLEGEDVDLLKLDIEGAEGRVLADCAGALARVRAMHVEVHEFDRASRACPAILRLLSDEGFTYAMAGLTPLPWRQPPTDDGGPFPRWSTAWVEAVTAWRA